MHSVYSIFIEEEKGARLCQKYKQTWLESRDGVSALIHVYTFVCVCVWCDVMWWKMSKCKWMLQKTLTLIDFFNPSPTQKKKNTCNFACSQRTLLHCLLRLWCALPVCDKWVVNVASPIQHLYKRNEPARQNELLSGLQQLGVGLGNRNSS